MSVYKRWKNKKILPSDPNWAKGKWYCYRKIDGKAIHKSLPEAQTKAQAEQAERRIIEELFNKKYGIAKSATIFDRFVDDTYLKYVRQHNTNIYVKEIYIRELKSFFGKKLLSDITAQNCRDYQYKRLHTKTRLGGKRSPSSVNKETSTLSKIFNLACQEQILDRNPMQFVPKLAEPAPRNRLLTNEEKQRLWGIIETDKFLYDIVRLAINLPLRKGQLLAITKEAVDFENRILMAAASKGRAARIVPLNETAFSVLRELSEQTHSGELLRINGKAVKDFAKRWRGALHRAGINKQGDTRENNLHFHDLRKFFTINLINKGVHLNTIQDLFNHSSPETTKIYAPSNLENMRDAVRMLDDVKVQESDAVN